MTVMANMVIVDFKMKFEDIFSMWETDSDIDKTELGDESLKIPKLHHKYYTVFVNERSMLKKLESNMKKLKLEKYEFYTQGHNEETREKKWKLPAKGMILKADIPMYIEADDDIIDMSLKIGVQQEKVEFLESILGTIKFRSNVIKNAIDWTRFTMGG
jgi:hypothetical protein